MKKVFTFISLVLLFIGSISMSYAQYTGDYEYSQETIWGITKATNSGLIGGGMIKHTRELKDNVFHGGMLEIVNIKHPQEIKYYARETGNTFIWGKQNYLYSIRMSYIREYTFFKKAAQQGVQVNGFLALGPTLGMEAPYYVDVKANGRTIKEQYDPKRHQFNEIVGTGNFLQGIGQSKIVPGINAKAGMSFEFGTFKSNVVGIEVGFQCDIFTREIILMPTTENYSIFPSAYATLFYGGRR